VLSLWGPFALFAALIGWMYFRVAFVPGGQAIGALESFYAKLAKRVTALVRRRDRARRRDPEGSGRRCCLTSSPRAR
jgi:lipopolysaccharide export system permease protein